MAKWGEGDARWIVQDRQDGANVNGWHWEEKNRMHWVRESIPAWLSGIEANCPTRKACVKFAQVNKVDGHASVSIRKQGKKLAIYDLTIEIKWLGKVEGAEEEVDGTIKIGEFASESDEDDWLIECTTIKTGKTADACRAVAAEQLQKLILDALHPLHDRMLTTLEQR
eukprot:jgi/Ulvmu1/9941/UM058_0024.1